MKVLDTTFLIDMIHGKKETEKVVESLEPLLTTQINMYEVIKGLFLKNITKARLVEVMDIFDNIRVLPFEDNALIKSAEIYSDLTKRGLEVHDLDCITAGIMLSKGINEIVTRNAKHFKKIKGITVENY